MMLKIFLVKVIDVAGPEAIPSAYPINFSATG